MPLLNRIITIGIEAEGDRDEDGHYIPGPSTDYRVWAATQGQGSTDAETVGGTRIFEIRQFTVRFLEVIARARTDLMTITDEYGYLWEPEEIAEGSRRRRYIEISARRVS